MLLLSYRISTEFRLYQWLRTNTVDRFSDDHSSEESKKTDAPVQQTWKERMEAQDSLQRYLSDTPSPPISEIVSIPFTNITYRHRCIYARSSR